MQETMLRLLVFLQNNGAARAMTGAIWQAAMESGIRYDTDELDLSKLPPLKTTED